MISLHQGSFCCQYDFGVWIIFLEILKKNNEESSEIFLSKQKLMKFDLIIEKRSYHVDLLVMGFMVTSNFIEEIRRNVFVCLFFMPIIVFPVLLN